MGIDMDNMKMLYKMFVILNSVFLMLLFVSIPICAVAGSSLFFTVTVILTLICDAVVIGLMLAEITLKRME